MTSCLVLLVLFTTIPLTAKSASKDSLKILNSTVIEEAKTKLNDIRSQVRALQMELEQTDKIAKARERELKLISYELETVGNKLDIASLQIAEGKDQYESTLNRYKRYEPKISDYVVSGVVGLLIGTQLGDGTGEKIGYSMGTYAVFISLEHAGYGKIGRASCRERVYCEV